MRYNFFIIIGLFSAIQCLSQTKKGYFSLSNAKGIEKLLSYIPSGYVIKGDCGEGEKLNKEKCKEIPVDSFYISKYEVSNGQYLEFLKELSLADPLECRKMLPDTLVWREKLSYGEPYVEYYFRHPAYRHYPLVGVSHQQAEAFCNWLTKKYMSDPKRKYKNVQFLLPAQDEWQFAAQGKAIMGQFHWETALQSRNGEWLANFSAVDQISVRRDSLYTKQENIYSKQSYIITENLLNTGYGMRGRTDVTVPVDSYGPAQHDLYNMKGNVEEFVKEKGITKGGSWRDPGYYLQAHSFETYDDTNEISSERGFRFIMKIKK